MLPHDQKDPREQLVNDLWWKACMGYQEQHVDPDCLLEFAVLVAKRCDHLVAESVAELKKSADCEILDTHLDAVKFHIRNKIHLDFKLD